MSLTVAVCCRTRSTFLAENNSVDLCLHIASVSLCPCISVSVKKSRTAATNVSPVLLTKSKLYISFFFFNGKIHQNQIN